MSKYVNCNSENITVEEGFLCCNSCGIYLDKYYQKGRMEIRGLKIQK